MFKIIFILLGTFSYIFANTTLSATGFASSAQMAKKVALQELIFQIKSTVATSLNIKEEVKNSKVDQDVKSKIDIKAKSFLLGVTYSDTIFKNNQYQTKAILSDEAIVNSIKNLYNDISKPIDLMSKKQKRLTLEKISFLKALLRYRSVDGVKLSKINSIENMLNKELNLAKILFKTDSNAIIEIADKKYNANKYFYLEPANYRYRIYSNGYYDESGEFYAQAGYSKIIKKDLIAKTKILNIYVQTDNKFKIYSDISAVLSKYGAKISKKSTADYVFKYKFEKESILKVGLSEFYRFSLNIDVYKNSKFLFTKKATLKRVAKNRLVTKAHLLAKALTKVVLKDIVNFYFINH